MIMDLKAVIPRQPVANPGFPRQGAPRGANPLKAGCETVSRQLRKDAQIPVRFLFHAFREQHINPCGFNSFNSLTIRWGLRRIIGQI